MVSKKIQHLFHPCVSMIRLGLCLKEWKRDGVLKKMNCIATDVTCENTSKASGSMALKRFSESAPKNGNGREFETPWKKKCVVCMEK